MKRLKNKGYLLVEILFSIALIAIISSVLIPNFVSVLNNNKRVSEKSELINFATSQMEEIIAYNYDTGDIKFPTSNEKYEVNIKNLTKDNYNFLKLNVRDKKTNEECNLEMVLPQKRLYSN